MDLRTKAFRAKHPPISETAEAFKALRDAPKPGEAETVLSILSLLGSYEGEVKKRILKRAGDLA